MKFIQNMVFAESELDLNTIFAGLKDDQTAKKYKNFLNYAKNSMLRMSEWAICLRKQLLTRGNTTDNYTESMIFIFKCIILRRIRAYNLLELFKFIVEDLDRYFQRKLLSLAFGKPQNLHIASRCFGQKASTVDLATITQDSREPFKFYVPSRKEKGTIYVVNSSIGMCSCPAGKMETAAPTKLQSCLSMASLTTTLYPQTIWISTSSQFWPLESIQTCVQKNLQIYTKRSLNQPNHRLQNHFLSTRIQTYR